MVTQNRYSNMVHNGKMRYLPLVDFRVRNSDKTEVFRKGVTTMDKLSYKYYGTSNYQWIIMMANQGYGSLEYDIPNGAILRIPYPLDEVLNEYNNKVNSNLITYGFKND